MSKRNQLERLPPRDLTTGVTPPVFDYDSVSSPVARFLKGQADRIRHHHVSSIVNIGKALLEAKRHLSHGAFQGWVESEVCMSVRTAQAYMRVAHWVSATKNTAIGRLPPTILYILSAPSTPQDFVSNILSRLEAGEIIAPSVIRKELHTLRLGRSRDDGMETEPGSDTDDRFNRWDKAEARRNAPADLSELVTILMERLSATDFERVRKIITSETVLSDPELSPNLRRVFMSNSNDSNRMLNGSLPVGQIQCRGGVSLCR